MAPNSIKTMKSGCEKLSEHACGLWKNNSDRSPLGRAGRYFQYPDSEIASAVIEDTECTSYENTEVY